MSMSEESKIQSVCRKLVEREVYHRASYLVSHFAQNPDACCGEVDYDDILNLCQRMPDHSERIEEIEERIEEIDTMLEHIDSEPYLTTAEVVEKSSEIDRLENEKKALEAEKDDLESDDDPVEALEHWIVSDWFATKLAEKGEITGELLDLTIWGRTCSGQAICLDSVIREIASDMEILPGQANSWE